MPTPPSTPSSSADRNPVAPIWHTAVFVIGLLGIAYLQHLPSFAAHAAQAPSRVPTYLLTICFELCLLAYVWFLGLKPYKIAMSDIVGGRWSRWGDFWTDVRVAIVFWAAIAAMLLVVSVTLHFSGAEAAKFLLPQTPAEMVIWVVLASTAGFCEEFIFRGYLQRQFLAWTGNRAAAVVLQGLIFGAGHWYQGTKGVVVISIYGMMFGVLAAMRKSLRPGMIQHGAQDMISGLVGHFAAKYHYIHVLRL